MKTDFVNFAFTGITVLLLAGCASMTKAPSTPPAATVRIQEWSAAYYGSAAAGKGTLYYNGQRYHFTISGLGVGGMGGQKVSATGKVYNLNTLHDFPGTYHGISRGLTLIEWKMPMSSSRTGMVCSCISPAKPKAWPPPWEQRHLRSA